MHNLSHFSESNNPRSTAHMAVGLIDSPALEMQTAAFQQASIILGMIDRSMAGPQACKVICRSNYLNAIIGITIMPAGGRAIEFDHNAVGFVPPAIAARITAAYSTNTAATFTADELALLTSLAKSTEHLTPKGGGFRSRRW